MIVAGEQMEDLIAVVGEEAEPAGAKYGFAGFETVLGKELKAGLHKVETALDGMEAVVAGKGTGKETELAEIETELEGEDSGFGEEEIVAEVDSMFAGVGTGFGGKEAMLAGSETGIAGDEIELEIVGVETGFAVGGTRLDVVEVELGEMAAGFAEVGTADGVLTELG